MPCIKQKVQWNKEFDGDIELFLKTAEGYDLLKALVRFSCNNTSYNCCHCPLASHNTSPPGRIDKRWGKHGWCGVELVAQDTYIGEGTIEASSFGQTDGSIRRMLRVGTGQIGCDWRWWGLRHKFLKTEGILAQDDWKDAIEWGASLFDIARFLFEFMPMWESKNDS
jgi:hypothetical protein